MTSSKSTAQDASLQKLVLPLLCICSFSTLLNIRAISPILVDISEEFGITVGVTGTLGIAYSIPAAFMALFFGPLSDRYGRRTLIIAGLIILFMSSIGSMLSPTFSILLVSRVLSGLGTAAVSPTVFAAVGDYFPYTERGRAYGWLVSATTMAVVLGIPLGSILAGAFTWRWMFALLSTAFLVVTILILTRLPKEIYYHQDDERGVNQFLTGFKRVFRNRNALAALLASLFFGLFWHGWATYSGAFFIETLGISTEDLAIVFTLQGLAILLASQLGRFLSDRFTKKGLAVIGMILAGAMMTILTNFGKTFILAIALNTLMAIPAGLYFVSGNALVSELIPASRGTFMALNSSTWEVGSMFGATLGGFVLGSTGVYSSLGIAFSISAVLAGIILYFFVDEVENSNRKDPIPIEQP